MRKWWDPLTILGKFCDVKKWVGRPNKETVKNLVGRREYRFEIVQKSSGCNSEK